MRKHDLHPTLQKTALAIPGRSGCYAVLPPPVPQHIDARGSEALFVLARDVIDGLNLRLQRYRNADLLLRCLNRREAVDSSQIEGTRTAFDDLLLYEMSLAAGDTSADMDARETLAYVQAYSHGEALVRERGTAALDQDLILSLHGILMAGKLKCTPGCYRDRQNYVGLTLETATYVPPPPAAVPELMADLTGLLQYRSEGVKHVSVLMRAAIAHVQFEAIHPFLDGNGRTGRMLIPFMLLAEAEPPLHLASFLKLRQQAYYDALWQVQVKQNWTPWMNLFLECVVASGRHTLRLMDELDRIEAGWGDTLRNARKRSHAAVWKIVRHLGTAPVLSVKETSRLTGVSFPAANAAIAELVQLDILRPMGERQRDRYFQAHAVLNAMHGGMDGILRQVESIRGV